MVGQSLGRYLIESKLGEGGMGIVRVDVVETVSWAGADSVGLRPPGLHILVSSSNSANQDRAALEIVFHEASHFLTGFNTLLGPTLAAAARDGGGTCSG